jgi:hypothetical protein
MLEASPVLLAKIGPGAGVLTDGNYGIAAAD